MCDQGAQAMRPQSLACYVHLPIKRAMLVKSHHAEKRLEVGLRWRLVGSANTACTFSIILKASLFP
jgi:hypothetical protein